MFHHSERALSLLDCSGVRCGVCVALVKVTGEQKLDTLYAKKRTSMRAAPSAAKIKNFFLKRRKTKKDVMHNWRRLRGLVSSCCCCRRLIQLSCDLSALDRLHTVTESKGEGGENERTSDFLEEAEKNLRFSFLPLLS